MKTIFFFFFYSLIFVLFFIITKVNHILSFLISLEIVGLYLLFVLLRRGLLLEIPYLVLSILTFSICESVVGLVLFVLYRKAFSKDYLFSINLLKF